MNRSTSLPDVRRQIARSSSPSLARIGLDANIPIVEAAGNHRPAYVIAKRVIDIIGSSIALILFSPLLIGVTIVLCFTTKGRPFFVQNRIGFRGKHFPMLKFRTMRLDAEQIQHTVANEHSSGPIFKNKVDPRVTTIGRWLRRTSIDEAPQLLNVLFGHMSLVGPRPPVLKEVKQYEMWHRRRLAVKPGLTCLWQVSGRSEIGFEDWIRMDLWYVRHQSFWVDLKLMALTPYSVLTCRGAY
jgi:lipopolysaccharide/colanic/teichoic acid biosynthesis glycosyltransferase